jgi:hypothetical protein
MPHCRNSPKMPHCRNSPKMPHCRNSPKIQYKNRRKRQMGTCNAQTHDHSLTWFGTGTSVKSGEDKSVNAINCMIHLWVYVGSRLHKIMHYGIFVLAIVVYCLKWASIWKKITSYSLLKTRNVNGMVLVRSRIVIGRFTSVPINLLVSNPWSLKFKKILKITKG